MRTQVSAQDRRIDEFSAGNKKLLDIIEASSGESARLLGLLVEKQSQH
jgi:hypothetical protein